MTVKDLYNEIIKIKYMVVDGETREPVNETYDLSTAIDEAEKIHGAVLRQDGTEVWNTEWMGTVIGTNRKTMMYHVMEEASEATMCYTEDIEEALTFARNQRGKYLVLDEEGTVLYDTQPEITYKI